MAVLELTEGVHIIQCTMDRCQVEAVVSISPEGEVTLLDVTWTNCSSEKSGIIAAGNTIRVYFKAPDTPTPTPAPIPPELIPAPGSAAATVTKVI